MQGGMTLENGHYKMLLEYMDVGTLTAFDNGKPSLSLQAVLAQLEMLVPIPYFCFSKLP